MKLTDEQKARFFQRSFKAVDGLWFIKAEDRYGFEKALELDKAVWETFPKIQVRELRAILGVEDNAAGFVDCYTAMLDLEGFEYKLERGQSGFRITASRCPWHDVMVKSGRAHLSARVGEVICRTEYSTWAAEFPGAGLKFSFGETGRLCTGATTCVLNFSK